MNVFVKNYSKLKDFKNCWSLATFFESFRCLQILLSTVLHNMLHALVENSVQNNALMPVNSYD